MTRPTVDAPALELGDDRQEPFEQPFLVSLIFGVRIKPRIVVRTHHLIGIKANRRGQFVVCERVESRRPLTEITLEDPFFAGHRADLVFDQHVEDLLHDLEMRRVTLRRNEVMHILRGDFMCFGSDIHHCSFLKIRGVDQKSTPGRVDIKLRA